MQINELNNQTTQMLGITRSTLGTLMCGYTRVAMNG